MFVFMLSSRSSLLLCVPACNENSLMSFVSQSICTKYMLFSIFTTSHMGSTATTSLDGGLPNSFSTDYLQPAGRLTSALKSTAPRSIGEYERQMVRDLSYSLHYLFI